MTTGTEVSPLVLIVSGPSGSGKSTLVQRLLELPRTMPSVSRTTRPRRSRGQDSEEEIARRLARARDEIQAFGKYYDYCVVNDDMERAGRDVQAILLALRCASARNRGFVERLLASFGRKT